MNKFRKTVSILCVLLMMLGLMAGCGSPVAQEVKEEVQEEANEVREEVTEEVNEAGQTVENMQDAASSEAAEIGEEAALGIALEDAGLSESDVNVVRCGLDYDDGRTEYEIEFYKDRTEYDYTLDAFTGEILEKSIEEGDD